MNTSVWLFWDDTLNLENDTLNDTLNLTDKERILILIDTVQGFVYTNLERYFLLKKYEKQL